MPAASPPWEYDTVFWDVSTEQGGGGGRGKRLASLNTISSSLTHLAGIWALICGSTLCRRSSYGISFVLILDHKLATQRYSLSTGDTYVVMVFRSAKFKKPRILIKTVFWPSFQPDAHTDEGGGEGGIPSAGNLPKEPSLLECDLGRGCSSRVSRFFLSISALNRARNSADDLNMEQMRLSRSGLGMALANSRTLA